MDGTNILLRKDEAKPPSAAYSGYPEPRVAAPNKYYSQILLETLGGPVGELTTFAQYTYHFQVLVDRNDLVARALWRMAQVEMYHLYLVGKAIRLLGGDPRYLSSSKTPWAGDQVYYGKDTCDRLAADLHLERLTVEQYRNAQSHIEDPFVQILIERVIQDEEVHVETLSTLMRSECKPSSSEHTS